MRIATSSSSGTVSVVRLTAAAMVVESTWQAHELYAARPDHAASNVSHSVARRCLPVRPCEL